MMRKYYISKNGDSYYVAIGFEAKPKKSEWIEIAEEEYLAKINEAREKEKELEK